ncbi:MAG TPA: FecR domain-containing protein [Planctomycetota bacterium]|nr:FecR domain-containing protein [Planctomycetota bacterium]
MDCRTSADLIARSLSGNASTQDDAQLRGHLASCPACADLERGLSATWSLLGRLPAVASKTLVPSVARPFTRRRRVWAVAAAAAAILVLAAIAVRLRTPQGSGTPQAPVAQQPPDVLPKEERQESAQVQEPPAPLEKPQVPAPVAPGPAAPETKTVQAPESPAPKPATPETPARPDPVAKSAPPETRAEEKRVVAPAAPAALPVVATIGRVEGDVLVLSGSLRLAVKAGQKLEAGASLETAKGSQVEVLFDDGTRVVLEADSLADSFQAEGGKRLTLKRGLLRARIAKQPAGEPMIFMTATAEARVLGTRLSLSVTPTATRLEVREGKVRITRRDDNASVDVSADHFVVAGKGQSLAPKPLPAKLALHETFDLPRWGGGWLQGGEANLGIRLAVENGSLSVKTLQKPAQDLGGGKMPSDAAELARKTLQNVNNVASLSRKDWPRSAWLETRQLFAFSNEVPIRIRIRDWNSHLDPDRIVWIALNHGVAGQGLSLERRGDSLQLWVEGSPAPVWKKDAAAPQEWETVELWLSKDQVVVRRNDETLYAGTHSLKIKTATLSLGSNAKMELSQDEEVRFDDVDVFLTTRAELEEVAR